MAYAAKIQIPLTLSETYQSLTPAFENGMCSQTSNAQSEHPDQTV